MINQDNWLINSCIDNSETVFPNIKCEFPLDNEIKEKLKELATNVKEDSNDFEIFRYKKQTDDLWEQLLKKLLFA